MRNRRGLNTLLVEAGGDEAAFNGFFNPPVYHASTVFYKTAANLMAERGKYRYRIKGA
jgi:cystathionine beta-lyase